MYGILPLMQRPLDPIKGTPDKSPCENARPSYDRTGPEGLGDLTNYQAAPAWWEEAMSKNEDKGPMRALHSAHLPNNAIPEVFQDLPGDLMNLSWAAAYTGLSIADLHRMAREG